MVRTFLNLSVVAVSICLVQAARAECRSGEMSIKSIVTGVDKNIGSLDIKDVKGPLCDAITIIPYDGEKAPKSCVVGSTVRARGHVDADYELPAIQAHAKDIHCTK